MRYKSQKLTIFIKSKIFYLIFYLILFSNCSHFDLIKKSNQSESIQESFFPNGNIEYRAELVNGKPDGYTKVWYEEGGIFSVSNYNNGMLHGKWEKFHKNGKLMFECNYVFGKKNGLEKWYYENGNIKSEQSFIDDNQNSITIRWDPNGNIIY